MAKALKGLLAVVLGTGFISGEVFSAEKTSGSADSMIITASQKIDNSINKVGNFMDDSAITAKVKSALIENKNIASNDISIKTDNHIVTLSGFVNALSEVRLATKVTKEIQGVDRVINDLHVRDTKNVSVSGYASDAVITSKVKAKLLATENLSSRHISVKTADGIVLLSGHTNALAQNKLAINAAKTVDGVKNVKSDLKVKP